jgi:SAM-dependent methyltransferase
VTSQGNGSPAASDPKGEELSAAIREIQQRVRARYPGSAAGPFAVALPDLLPILHARDTAEAKVASIGTVNPRPPGLINNIAQAVKRTVARALGWHVRDQVVFNRAVLGCVEATLDALNDFNRTIAALASQAGTRYEEQAAAAQTRFDSLAGTVDSRLNGMQESLAALHEKSDVLRDEARELKDVRTHWAQWRVEWERKLSINEVQFLRSVADLQAGFQHRVTLLESAYREVMGIQNKEFTATLEKGVVDVQKRLWDDLRQVRMEYDRLIHNELRLIRQRMGTMPVLPAEPATPVTPTPAAVLPVEAVFDYARFADKFRGTEEYVRERQRGYLGDFAGCQNVLDIGCGRGEFLDLMKEAGVAARGIDLSGESVAVCRAKGYRAEVADLFAYLAAAPEGSLDGIFSAQVVEHLEPLRIPEMIRLAASCLKTGGVLVIETPNPECLAIFATHFYLDPTHTRPVPPALLRFYFEEAGLGAIELRRLAPAVETMPAIAELPEAVRTEFFDGLDYALVGRRV